MANPSPNPKATYAQSVPPKVAPPLPKMPPPGEPTIIIMSPNPFPSKKGVFSPKK